MFKVSLVLPVIVALLASVTFAQEDAATVKAPAVQLAQNSPADPPAPASQRRASRSASKTIPTATPLNTPSPKKRGFFDRLFGKRPKATPRPGATPAPSPSQRRKKASSPTSSPVENAAATSAERSPRRRKPAPPSPSESQKDDAATAAAGAQSSLGTESAAQPSGSDKPAPATTKSSASKRGSATKKATELPPEGSDPEAAEKFKYDQAKATAMEDPEVQKLKQKADAAGNEEEVRAALRAYNKALFRKMRRTDPELKDRIDRMEAGVMKRLGEQP